MSRGLEKLRVAVCHGGLGARLDVFGNIDICCFGFRSSSIVVRKGIGGAGDVTGDRRWFSAVEQHHEMETIGSGSGTRFSTTIWKQPMKMMNRYYSSVVRCDVGRRDGRSNSHSAGISLGSHEQPRQISSAHPTMQQQQQRQQEQEESREVFRNSKESKTGRKLELRERIDAVPTVERDSSKIDSLPMKAQVIFDASWKKMEAKFGDSYICPREIVWLNGAPGAGKGTNVPFIMKSRGLSRSLGMSQLLESSSEIRSIIDRGDLVPDGLVLDALLETVLNPEYNDGSGLVIDGFPRTATQVDFVKALYDKLGELHHKAAEGPDEWRFPRPSFKVVILYVDEEESVKRQTKRAKLASLHNRRVLDAGTGDVWSVRSTDISEALCRRRYQVFKAHYATILRLKSYFPFSLIDAMGTLDETRSQIVRELRYQSSLDLDERTYAAIRHLPLAKDLVRVARQRLVFRLDSYCRRHTSLFMDVIAFIDSVVLPVLKQCSLAGHAEFKTRHPLLLNNPLAIDILIDVLTDRGFSVAHAEEVRLKPHHVNLKSGDISCKEEAIHTFRITFAKENVRDLSASSSSANRHGESVAIGTTWVPEHMRRDEENRHDLQGYSDISSNVISKRKNVFGLNIRGQNMENRDEKGKKLLSKTVNGSSQMEHSSKDRQVDDRRLTHEEGTETYSTQYPFLRGWDSTDPDLNGAAQERYYGFEQMNERED